nr:2',3'-cyclic-nucleotide 3'-phosphodiesterase [Labrus bergylta]
MDLEKSGKVLDLSEPPQQEKSVMEKEVVSKLEIPEESTEPENPPAADGGTEQLLPMNGHGKEVDDLKETEEVIVTETVTFSEETTEMEIEDTLLLEKSVESLPVVVAPPEPDESSEKISDPVAVLDEEPENTQPQEQQVSENDPEPLLVQTPLADITEPEPEKLSESVSENELEAQTSPDPAEVQQLVDTEPPSQEETVSEPVETETELQTSMDTQSEDVAKESVEEDDVAVENDMTAEPTGEAEEEEEKPAERETFAETVIVTEASLGNTVESEELVQTVLVTEAPAETMKVMETEFVADITPEKPAETEKVMETELLADTTPEKPAETEKVMETELLADTTPEKPAETEKVMETELLADTTPEKPAEKEQLVATELVADIAPEKPAEKDQLVATELVADIAPEKPAEKEQLVATELVADIAPEKPAEKEQLVVTELVADIAPEKPAETEKIVDTVLVSDVSSEKPAEAVTLKEEAPAEIENIKPAEEKKEVEPEKSFESEALKGVEAATEGESVASEAKDVELEKEEETVPASGSLLFALLQQEQTKDALRTSRTLVVLRGLPGSGKSFLARAIADTYKDHCSIFCADEHGVKPESPETSADGYKALDEAVVGCCSAAAASSVLVVVDDTNHTQERLAHLGEIADQHHLVAVFLEPRTEWSRDPAQLTKKTRRGLDEAQLEAMRGPLAEMSLPLFFGWFLLSSVQDKIRCTSMDFLKTLDTLDAFKKHLIDFTGKAEKEVDLEQYFQAKGTLHCTTKFCDYGKAEGAKDYAENQAVNDLYGSVSELSLSALFVTPRTVGARVSLTEEQLVLWPADAEKEADVPAAASLPRGSRAHITLGCSEGVEPVQTGVDLLEILALQQEGQQGELVEEMELGSLTYYGSGRWLLSLREPICAPACFSSYYGRKEAEPTKKEPERRRKPKCTIL